LTLPAPTEGQTERLRSAIIQKATRFLVIHHDPLGFGDIGELGPVSVRPDYPTRDFLFGLHAPDWEVEDLAALVTPDDVIRNGFGADPAQFPPERIPDVQREIDAAADWIRTELHGAFGVA
jgi:hypothetical protein